MPEVNTRLRATGFGLWAFVFAFLVTSFSDRTWTKDLLLTIPHYALSLSMELFLLFKLAHYLPKTTSRTTEWHDFFYESKEGSWVLVALCTVWFFNLSGVVLLCVGDMLFAGHISGIVGAFAKSNIIAAIFTGLIVWFSPFYLLFLMAWLFWTGAKAFWRVAGGPRIRLDLDQEEPSLGFMGRN